MSRSQKSQKRVNHLPQATSAGLALAYARESTLYDKRKRENKLRLVSGESEREVSLDTQVNGILGLASERGFSVPKDAIFKERFTGYELFDRPLLTEVRKLIATRKYAALICHDSDRLARKTVHLMILAEECVRAGVELIFVEAPLDQSAEGQLLLYVSGYAAEKERERIRERTMRGRRAAIQSNTFIQNGLPLYGYTFSSAENRREIKEPQAKVVRMIFDLCLTKQLSASAIARHLNERGIPSPAVAKGMMLANSTPLWSRQGVLRILHDPCYTGRTFANRYKLSDRKHKKDGTALGYFAPVPAPREEWIELSGDGTPAVVSVDDFEKAQQFISANVTHSRRKARNEQMPFLLREMIYCGRCGKKMYTNFTNRNGRGYRCSARFQNEPNFSPKSGDTCNTSVSAAYLEERIWASVLTYFARPELIEFELRKARQSSKGDDIRGELTELDKQLGKVKRTVDSVMTRLTAAIEEGDELLADKFQDDVKMYGRQLKALQVERDGLEARLSSLANANNVLTRFKEYCAVVREGLARDLSFEAKAEALRSLGVKVYAMPKRSEQQTKIQINTGALIQAGEASKNGPTVCYRRR